MEVFGGTSLESLSEWSAARSVGEAWRLARASVPTVLRLGAGARVLEMRGKRPARMLELYERENDAGSRRVREALSMLDLDAVMKPVPHDSRRHSQELANRFGSASRRVPLLVDQEVGVVIEGADGIVEHLFAQYATTRVPLRLRMKATSSLASRLRGENGARARPSRMSACLLELWGYEASPATRIVRERLTELELAYVARQLAPHSPRRGLYFAREGTMELPRLEDPSHSVSCFGADAITRYLEHTYALERASPPARRRGRERRQKGSA